MLGKKLKKIINKKGVKESDYTIPSQRLWTDDP